MSGKTDPQIVREYLALMESDDPTHLPSILEHLERELAAAAEELASDGSPCPGAPELLAALARDDRFHSSVLTGNIAPNAVVKLAAFGLEKWVDMETGAYGSDSEDRKDLVPDSDRAPGVAPRCSPLARGDLGDRGHAPRLRVRGGRLARIACWLQPAATAIEELVRPGSRRRIGRPDSH